MVVGQKSALYSAVDNFGVNRILRHLHRHDLLVLVYHSIDDDSAESKSWQFGNTVGWEEFDYQLHYIRRYFYPISTAELRYSLAHECVLPDRAVLVTFDDGYQNNLTAAERMKRLGIPAVFHVTAGYVGTERILWTEEVIQSVVTWPTQSIRLPDGRIVCLDTCHRQRGEIARVVREGCKCLANSAREKYMQYLRSVNPNGSCRRFNGCHRFLTWDEIRTIQAQGFEIGSHTVEHPILSRVDVDELDRELRESKDMIEFQTGKECFCFAYPNGSSADYTAKVVSRVAAAGYELAFTVGGGLNSSLNDSLRINRIAVPGHLTPAVFKATVSGVRSSVNKLRVKEVVQDGHLLLPRESAAQTNRHGGKLGGRV